MENLCNLWNEVRSKTQDEDEDSEMNASDLQKTCIRVEEGMQLAKSQSVQSVAKGFR